MGWWIRVERLIGSIEHSDKLVVRTTWCAERRRREGGVTGKGAGTATDESRPQGAGFHPFIHSPVSVECQSQPMTLKEQGEQSRMLKRHIHPTGPRRKLATSLIKSSPSPRVLQPQVPSQYNLTVRGNQSGHSIILDSRSQIAVPNATHPFP